MSRMNLRRRNQGGFTIIELLIATLVFAMVLILITVGVLSFTKAYYRGITQSNTQNTARTVMESISQSVQFSGDTVTSPIDTTGSNSSVGFCVGSTRYSYLLGYQLVDGTPDTAKSQTKHSLLRDTPGLCGGLSAQNVRGASVNGTEMLQPNMRLAKLSVESEGSGLYKVTVRVVYGDDDLLFSPSGNALGAKAPDANCKTGVSGSQFCAVSELSTTVKKRIIPTQ